MFTAKLTPTQQQMLQILTSSQHKGLSFLQMYNSPDRNQALLLLNHLETQTVKQIKENLEAKCNQTLQTQSCRNFCSNFYYAHRSYTIKSRKRNWALFGIGAFTLLGVLCTWVLFKVITYYFVDHGDSGEVVETTVRSVMAAAGKFIGLFVLGSYSSLGLWYGSGFLLLCISSYFHRKKQSAELKAEMQQLIQRHRRLLL